MSILTEVYTSVIVALSQTETPAPTPMPMPGFDGNADLVTPTWVGFLMTFLVAVATLLLILDMTRRVRRTRYREEIGEMLAAEAAAESATESAPETATESATETSARAGTEGTDPK